MPARICVVALSILPMAAWASDAGPTVAVGLNLFAVICVSVVAIGICESLLARFVAIGGAIVMCAIMWLLMWLAPNSFWWAQGDWAGMILMTASFLPPLIAGMLLAWYFPDRYI